MIYTPGSNLSLHPFKHIRYELAYIPKDTIFLPNGDLLLRQLGFEVEGILSNGIRQIYKIYILE
jgi:hypothetical protein